MGCTPCPADKPKFNGAKCVACLLPTYWNSTEQDCVLCTNGRIYSTQIQNCVCEDPSTFYNNVSCIKCFHPQYFDFESLECLSCPPKQIYDIDRKQCINCPV